MSQVIKLLRSNTPGKVPTTQQLDVGSLAINTYDGKIYLKKSGSFGEEIVGIFISGSNGGINLGKLNFGNGLETGYFDAKQDTTINVDPTKIDITQLKNQSSKLDSSSFQTHISDFNNLVTTVNGLVNDDGPSRDEYDNDSSSFDSRISDISSSYYNFTNSFYATSASIDERILNNLNSILYLSSSFITFTSSYFQDSSSFDNRINNINIDTSSLDNNISFLSSSFIGFTGSYYNDSASFDFRINNATGSSSTDASDLTSGTLDDARLSANVPIKVGGLIQSSDLPAYVDDVIEGYKLSTVFYEDVSHTIVITGEVGKIYVDLTTGQSSKQYRWSGSTYIQITNGLIASTADVPENAGFKYFTDARAIGALLTGYVKSVTNRALTATDSILTAIGILEKKADDNTTALDLKANDSDVVHRTGDESKEGNLEIKDGILSIDTDNGAGLQFKNSSYIANIYPGTLDNNVNIAIPINSGTLALTSDLTSYVTTDTKQTITGEKTFTSSIFNGKNRGLWFFGDNSYNTGISSTRNVIGDSSTDGEMLYFQTNEIPRLRIFKNGNIWIGPYFSSSADDGNLLQVRGDINITGTYRVNGTPIVTGGETLQSVTDRGFTTSNGASFAGNVGIGTTTPTEKLEVNGNVKANSFIKSGGTSSQFLKADGGIDTTDYQPKQLPINNQTASYTLVLTDAGKMIELNNASANNLTIPLNSVVAFPIGTQIIIYQMGAGQTTFVATSGVTIRQRQGFTKTAGQYALSTLIKRDTDTWILGGDLQ